MNEESPHQRLIDLDLEAEPAPHLLLGVQAKLAARRRKFGARLTAAAMVVGLGLMALVLFVGPHPDDNGASSLAKEGEVDGEKAETKEVEAFPELGKYAVLVGNHAINPETGKEEWRLDEKYKDTYWEMESQTTFVDARNRFFLKWETWETRTVAELERKKVRSSNSYTVSHARTGFVYTLTLAATQPKPDPRSQLAVPPRAYHLRCRGVEGSLQWEQALEADPSVHLCPTSQGVMVVTPTWAKFFGKDKGEVLSKHFVSKSRKGDRVFSPSDEGLLVEELDKARILIASYESSGANEPLGFIINPRNASTIAFAVVVDEYPTHSEYWQHCYVLPRKGHFVLVSLQMADWYIEVRNSEDGSLVKRWTKDNVTFLSEDEIKAQT
ncbi:MAG: hypothetical protein KDB07_03935, partial [Planctomycetes bacterium]|nr:hypothetical protein [Planctomycetota bacterium]